MFLRQLDLTTALRPSLYDDENLLFVQAGVGLYEGKFKIPHYQNGYAYLTTHRVCYVDNDEPRRYSVAIDLKEIDRTEFYAGFLKSSPKVTLFPKIPKKGPASVNTASPRYSSPSDALVRPATSAPRPRLSPAPVRDASATWICPICGMSNGVPPNFDPATANQHRPLPPCRACGVEAPLALLIKATIAAMSNRSSGAPFSLPGSPRESIDVSGANATDDSVPTGPLAPNQCPRCTFQNHPSLATCEVCGAALQGGSNRLSQLIDESVPQLESPGPSLSASSIVGDESIETIKFSFREGGAHMFQERLQNALVQRKWLLHSAPPIPKPSGTPQPVGSLGYPNSEPSPTSAPRIVGIAGLEQRGAELRQSNQAVIGTAFEDLEALMTSAKEVINMAEQFAKRSNGNSSDDAMRLISDSASALGLMTTKDMLGTGSSAEQLYVNELSRDIAEFLTDDVKGVLRKEGGIMSLVDLWQVFNRARNGIELVSPLDFEKAANRWEALHLPVRLRRFRSGLLVVQDRSRTDEKTIASVLSWLREPQYTFPPLEDDALSQAFGRGVTAHETAERFGWSVGVATEELEMAEEVGAVCRDQCLDGTRFWDNHLVQNTAGSRR